MKHIQSLSGSWQFRQVGTPDWLPATVPGGVHTDLLTLGQIPDPFISDNELEVMWIAEKDWEYRYTFSPHARLRNHEQIYLVADGLDTLAEVRLNGKILGKTANQFRQWRWEIKDLLVAGENTLEVYFYGPSAFVAAEQKRRRLISLRRIFNRLGIRLLYRLVIFCNLNIASTRPRR